MSSIQQDFVESILLRGIDRASRGRVVFEQQPETSAQRSELMCFLHNRFRLSVRVNNPGNDGRADLPFSDMNAACFTKAGVAIYSWKDEPGVPPLVVQHSVTDATRHDNV